MLSENDQSRRVPAGNPPDHHQGVEKTWKKMLGAAGGPYETCQKGKNRHGRRQKFRGPRT